VFPEIALGAARTISGINYKTLVRTAYPTVGFRAANQGVDETVGTYENRLVETYIMNPQWLADKAVADRHEDGASAYIAMEAAATLGGAMTTLGKCFFYGTNATYGDADGFTGLLQAIDDANMIVDGEGAESGACSSVWAVRFGPQDVTWVWGNNGDLSMSDVTEERVLDSDSKPYTAYRQELLSYPGLQVGNKNAVGAIKNLDTAGQTLTDDLLIELYSKFPTGRPPTCYFATRRSIMQLQQSRTATTATGQPAQWPTDCLGIPIYATDSISNATDPWNTTAAPLL